MNALQEMEALMVLAPQVGGVFTHGELSSIFRLYSPLLLNRKIHRYLDAGILRRYCRGVYVCKEFQSGVLAQKVRPGSYLSLGSALAWHRMIGTEPRHEVFSVGLSPNAEFAGPPVLSYSHIEKRLLFGVQVTPLGVRIADPAKALLDTLYFYQKGTRYFFQVFQDIDTSIVDRHTYNSYLAEYYNPRFRAFAQRYLDGQFALD